VRVAFQGEPGAYSEEAVVRIFGEAVDTVPCPALSEVFDAVASRRVDRGVVPVENSQAGSINETYDLLLAYAPGAGEESGGLVLAGELDLRVRHCLLALPGQPLEAITRAFSHPQALAQCEAYLHARRIEAVPYYDTAGSAKMIHTERQAGCAAIASRRAAQIYELAVLAEGIETNPNNYTRFLVLDRSPAPRGEASKTSIVFALEHRPGTLYGALGALATRQINLTKIESRTGRARRWEYLFYVDFEGHADDALVQAALRDLRQHTTFLRILGSYPRSPQPAPAR